MLFDAYLQFKTKQLARATPFEVHIHPLVDVDIASLIENMSYAPIHHHNPGSDLPLKVFEAHPVTSKKILSFYFAPESTEEVSRVITGVCFWSLKLRE